ncbi:MAG: cysteine desulfurase [Crocinitomicaceae bacterium]|nr:cysteine desulfurase [Crocinitomicaceae bacterium]
MQVTHFDVESLRKDFPLLNISQGKNPYVYFDNGATSQKPQVVIDRLKQYYDQENANVHRGVHQLSQISTDNFEESRRIVRRFLNAEYDHEIIFTAGTTNGINLVATSFGTMLSEGDEILISELEHHSNIVPWQMLAHDKNLVLKYIPINNKGEWILDDISDLITDKTKLIAVSHVSNSLGTINPVEKIIEEGKKFGAKILVDGAQAIQHFKVDVQKLDCDFYVFSGHKVFGPTGTGILYGKESVLNAMPPYQGGGDMIKTVSMSGTVYNELPHKFEAGTPNIAGVIGLGVAIEWFMSIDTEAVAAHENDLLVYAHEKLSEIEGIKIYGTSDKKCSLISFLVGDLHPYDVGTLLNQQGVAVRTGHHCTQPVMEYYGIPGTIRASFSLYNTKEEVDYFIKALKRAIRMLS